MSPQPQPSAPRPAPFWDELPGLLLELRNLGEPSPDLDLRLYCALTGERWRKVRTDPILRVDQNLVRRVRKPGLLGDAGTCVAEMVDGKMRLVEADQFDHEFDNLRIVPAYTGSMDATLALAGQVIPGWHINSQPWFYEETEPVVYRSWAVRPRWERYNPSSGDWFDSGQFEARLRATSALGAVAEALKIHLGRGEIS